MRVTRAAVDDGGAQTRILDIVSRTIVCSGRDSKKMILQYNQNTVVQWSSVQSSNRQMQYLSPDSFKFELLQQSHDFRLNASQHIFGCLDRLPADSTRAICAAAGVGTKIFKLKPTISLLYPSSI